MNWSVQARAKIAEIHRSLPEDASFTARVKALRNGYPFGERKYWPYKAWCKARREYLRKYDPKTPAPPLLREMLKDRTDIIFPFAKDKDA